MNDPKVYINFIEPDKGMTFPDGRYERVQIQINNDCSFGFNIKMVPADQQEWLMDVVAERLMSAYKLGAKDKAKEIKTAHEDFLNSFK